MTTKWNGPPIQAEDQRARESVEAGGQDDPQNTHPFSSLQFMHRRAAGLERLNVIFDDLAADHGWPICTATTEAAS